MFFLWKNGFRLAEKVILDTKNIVFRSPASFFCKKRLFLELFFFHFWQIHLYISPPHFPSFGNFSCPDFRKCASAPCISEWLSIVPTYFVKLYAKSCFLSLCPKRNPNVFLKQHICRHRLRFQTPENFNDLRECCPQQFLLRRYLENRHARLFSSPFQQTSQHLMVVPFLHPYLFGKPWQNFFIDFPQSEWTPFLPIPAEIFSKRFQNQICPLLDRKSVV